MGHEHSRSEQTTLEHARQGHLFFLCWVQIRRYCCYGKRAHEPSISEQLWIMQAVPLARTLVLFVFGAEKEGISGSAGIYNYIG